MLFRSFLEFFKQKDPSIFSPERGFPERDRIRVQKFVFNIRVKTARTAQDRTVVIKNLSNTGASNTTFTMRDNTQPISVADYFRLHANITLRFPDNICIEVCCLFIYCLDLILIPVFSLDRDWGIYSYRIM